MSDAEQDWPREIWLAELDEHHNGSGMVVLSKFATVPRWEGDDERDCPFQRYVDSDIYESAEKYFSEKSNELRAEIARLQAQIETAKEALRIIASHRRECHEYDDDCGYGRRTFDSEDVRLMEWQARAALKEMENTDDRA